MGRLTRGEPEAIRESGAVPVKIKVERDLPDMEGLRELPQLAGTGPGPMQGLGSDDLEGAPAPRLGLAWYPALPAPERLWHRLHPQRSQDPPAGQKVCSPGRPQR